MKITSKVIPLLTTNIDTDQIIPAQFLKSTSKEDFGKNLFYHWRYNSDGSKNEDFVFNKEQYKNCKILIAGNNFGCGSSREHATWALKDYGIDIVISTQFADIFKTNAYKNQILPIEVSEETFAKIVSCITLSPESEMTVDLENQAIQYDVIEACDFSISPYYKECLLSGSDETDYLVNMKSEIEHFEKSR